jgi:DNA-binding IclR family transcriptional regulator
MKAQKITKKIIQVVTEERNKGLSFREIALKLNLELSLVIRILTDLTYKHLKT